LKLLQQRYDEELRQQEIMYSLQSQGSLQKEMMSFEAECEIKMQKQMQRVCTKLVDDVRIEEAIKYKQELEILRIQVEGRNIERIQQTVSEERTRYLKHLELFQEENNMRQQEHENWLCEVSKQKHNMEIERMALEAQKKQTCLGRGGQQKTNQRFRK
jgi:alpha-glucosidase (family GH31 glycosyl hydrolase)